MADAAKGDEIFFHVASQKASRLNVMDLEIFGTSASLASPAIALEHLLPEPSIGTRSKRSLGCLGTADFMTPSGSAARTPAAGSSGVAGKFD